VQALTHMTGPTETLAQIQLTAQVNNYYTSKQHKVEVLYQWCYCAATVT